MSGRWRESWWTNQAAGLCDAGWQDLLRNKIVNLQFELPLCMTLIFGFIEQIKQILASIGTVT